MLDTAGVEKKFNKKIRKRQEVILQTWTVIKSRRSMGFLDFFIFAPWTALLLFRDPAFEAHVLANLSFTRPSLLRSVSGS